MKTFNHVLITWITSISLMILIAVGYENYQSGPGNFGEILGMSAFSVVIAAFFAAIPSLVIGWYILNLLLKTNCLPPKKYLLWCFSTIVAVSLNILLPFLFFFRQENTLKIFFNFWPAYAGTITAVFIRSKQFLSLIKNIQHENNLV